MYMEPNMLYNAIVIDRDSWEHMYMEPSMLYNAIVIEARGNVCKEPSMLYSAIVIESRGTYVHGA